MNSKPITLGIALGIAIISLAATGQEKPAYTDTEAGKHVGEEATVTGKLVSIFTSGAGTTFLNLGDRFPRNTFGGVIFAGNQAAVGDVKQYEGKEVSLTGRIDLDKNQKPQIIINSAAQIKLAGAPGAPAPSTPATPPPAPGAPVAAVPMTTPPAPPAPPPPVTSSEPPVEKRMKNINLASGWNSPRRGGEMVRKDLARLFAGAGTASETTTVDASIEVYPGVPFLTPLTLARTMLNLDGSKSSEAKVSTPGFPQDSLSATMFNGVFIGGYTRLYFITDSSDRVVSALVVDTGSRTRVPNEPDTTGYHTYNFVTGGAKATGNLMIKHHVTPASKSGGVVIVDSMLIDPTDPEPQAPGISTKSRSSRPKTGKVLERSRWFVPAPVVNLILRCVGG